MKLVVAIALLAWTLVACGHSATPDDAATDAPMSAMDTPTVLDAPTGACTRDRDCPSATFCDRLRGACVACDRSDQCPSDRPVCSLNQCVSASACASARQCPGQVCDFAHGRCVDCLAPVDCPHDQVCVHSLCEPAPTPCASSRTCSATGLVCDTDVGVCTECLTDSDCDPGQACSTIETCERVTQPIDAGLDASRDAETDAARIDAVVDVAEGGPLDGAMSADVRPDVSAACGTLTLCGVSCVDTGIDPAHCGACDRHCASPAHGSVACSAGACVTRCDPGYVATPGGCVAVPRPQWPPSGSTVTTRRPALRWFTAAGVGDATVDLCRDRACTVPIGSSIHVTGNTLIPPTDLPVGTVYWRLRTGITAAPASATWQFRVGARSAPVGTAWGTTLDVNGDGFADVATALQASDGRVYVYHGHAAGASTTPDTTLMALDGGVQFGSWLGPVGDVDGDGFPDFGVRETTCASGSACVSIYRGSAAGLITTPIVIVNPEPMMVSNFGDVGPTALGDIDGDGYADIALGGSTWGFTQAGRLYVYRGGPTGPAPTPSAVLDNPGGPGSFGAVSAGLGDVNGDGYSDALVMAQRTRAGYVYLGSAAGLASTPSVTLADGVSGQWGVIVQPGGDLDGDGYEDVAIGDSLGAFVMVYFGGATGITTTRRQRIDTPDGVSTSGFGISVGSPGDIDGDGYPDLVVGSDTTHVIDVYPGSVTGPVIARRNHVPPPVGSDRGFGEIVRGDDVDGDGYADIFCGDSNAAGGRSAGYLFSGSSSGIGDVPHTTWSPPASMTSPFGLLFVSLPRAGSRSNPCS